MVRRRRAGQGAARRDVAGGATLGAARHGTAGYGRHCWVGLAMARYGTAWQAWRGPERHGMSRPSRRGRAWLDGARRKGSGGERHGGAGEASRGQVVLARLGPAGGVRLNGASRGASRHGRHGLVRSVMARCGWAGKARPGKREVWRGGAGMVGCGVARFGEARSGSAGAARDGVVIFGEVWRVMASQGSAGADVLGRRGSARRGRRGKARHGGVR